MSQNRNWLIQFADGLYYSRNSRWNGVIESKATWLSHEEAYRLLKQMRKPRMGMHGRLVRKKITHLLHDSN